MSQIQYTPLNAGYVVVSPDPHTPLSKADHDSLSYLVFHVTYTKVGRDLWANNRPYPVGAGGGTPAAAKAALTAALQNEFAGVAATDREALIDAHIAASLYIKAKETRDQQVPGGAAFNQAQADMDTYEFAYKQKMAFICSQLYEYSLAHDFSMSW